MSKLLNIVYYSAMASVLVLGSVVALTSCTEPFKQTASKPLEQDSQPKRSQAKPAQGKIIAIDVGHSLKALGATSTTGIGEFHYNLNIAKQLKADLESRGFKAVLIGADGQMTKLEPRPRQAMQLGADAFISIHHDSAAEKDIKQIKYNGKLIEGTTANYGHSVFVSRKSKQNIVLGARIGKGFNDNGLAPTLYHKGKRELLNDKRGLYEFGDLRVLKASNIPSALVECGVIKNPMNEAELSTASYQAKIVDSIADGIQAYFEGAANE